MSVLIKGMKMPESCLNCPLETDYGTCGHFNGADYAKHPTEYNSRPVWCPLVPIPQHGRLIDADALIAVENRIRTYYPESGDESLIRHYILDYITLEQVKNAPTILEAEEGEQ